MAEARLISIPRHHDERGWLYVADEGDVPFAIRRVFWICGVPQGITRGGHAHVRCEQVLIAVAGGVTVCAGNVAERLRADGAALYVPTFTRIDMYNWQPGTVLLVLCSEPYDARDYVYD